MCPRLEYLLLGHHTSFNPDFVQELISTRRSVHTAIAIGSDLLAPLRYVGFCWYEWEPYKHILRSEVQGLVDNKDQLIQKTQMYGPGGSAALDLVYDDWDLELTLPYTE